MFKVRIKVTIDPDNEYVNGIYEDKKYYFTGDKWKDVIDELRILNNKLKEIGPTRDI